MILNKSHIGREVKYEGDMEWKIIIAVDDDEAWFKLPPGDHCTHSTRGNWILKPLEKLPSERILEIYRSKELPSMVEAVRDFLDELHKEGKI